MKQNINITCRCGRGFEVSHLAPKFVSDACPACVMRFGPGDFNERIGVKSNANMLFVAAILAACFGLWELLK